MLKFALLNVDHMTTTFKCKFAFIYMYVLYILYFLAWLFIILTNLTQ